MRYHNLLFGAPDHGTRPSRYNQLVDAIDELTEIHDLLGSLDTQRFPVSVLQHHELELAIQTHWVIGCLAHWPDLWPLIEEVMANGRLFAGTAGLARLRALRAGQKAVNDHPLAFSVWSAKRAYCGLPAPSATSIADAVLFATKLVNRFAQ